LGFLASLDETDPPSTLSVDFLVTLEEPAPASRDPVKAASRLRFAEATLS
jgi:hypothetical protein